MRKCMALLLAFCFLVLCGCTASPEVTPGELTETQLTETELPTPTPVATEEPKVLPEINHAVMAESLKATLEEADLPFYAAVVNAVLRRKETVELEDDYMTNIYIMYVFEKGPFNFLVSYYDFATDNKTLRLRYDYTAEEQEEYVGTLDREFYEIINSCVTEEMTDREKIEALYRYFCERISYDDSYDGRWFASSDPEVFSGLQMYQALKENKGVCHHYAYLLEYALLQLGFDAERVSGKLDGTGHMWVTVKLGDELLWLDPTRDAGKPCPMKYFLVSEEEAKAS